MRGLARRAAGLRGGMRVWARRPLASVGTLLAEADRHVAGSDLQKASRALYSALELQLKTASSDLSPALATVDRLVALHLAAAMTESEHIRVDEEIEAALRLYEAAETLVQNAGDHEQLLALKVRRGSQLSHFPAYEDKAVEALEEAVALAAAHELPSSMARIGLARLLQEVRKPFAIACQPPHSFSRQSTEHDDRVMQLYQQAAAEGTDPMVSASASSMLGAFLLQRQRFDEAEQTLRHALEIMEPLPKDHPFVVQAQSLLVHSLSMLSRTTEAAALALEVVSIVSDMKDADADMADALMACAIALDLNEDPKMAITVLEQAKEIASKENAQVGPIDELLSSIKERMRNSAGLDKMLD